MMTSEHQDQQKQKTKRITALETELTTEKNTANKLRNQLRELNIQLKEKVAERTDEVKRLQKEFDNAKEELLGKEEIIATAEMKLQDAVQSHEKEMQSLINEYNTRISSLENDSADIVSDLEDEVKILRERLFEQESMHQQAVRAAQESQSWFNAEKERMQRQLSDAEQKRQDQQTTIQTLKITGKKRTEEVKSLRADLSRVKADLERTTRESDETIDAIRNKLEEERSIHQNEMSDMQTTLDDVKEQLAVAKEKIESEGGELHRIKTLLAERTTLLGEMVNQNTTYHQDYEQEMKRANQLQETLEVYKRDLAEARSLTTDYERELNEKEEGYMEALGNERHQRKLALSNLESMKQEMEEIKRRNKKMEKENDELQNKVTRSKKYIEKLHDAKKEERDRKRGPLGPSRLSNRPSSAEARRFFRASSPSKSPCRDVSVRGRSNRYTSSGYSSHHVHHGSHPSTGDENVALNTARRPVSAPMSPDELDEFLA
mmetsp:Transcript_21662/g.44457  ORF Transcript_21662/g.44457 Transcript_21662/m.44457 type:complete len:490 (+) Transcript_21662:615-2084(+)